jgi:hypothetical protein
MGAVLLGAVVPGAVLPGTGRGGSRPRIGLVLGAGHLTGAAWMTGALPALQDRLSRAISDADVIIGTSAGSVLAASIRCRCSIEEMIGYQRGEVVDGLPQVTERSRPPLPQPRMGSPALWCTALLTPHRVHPRVSATAWVPPGRGRHTALRAMVGHLHARHLHAHGIKVTVLTPGPEDLTAMGVNPMDVRRREAVLATSLRTSPASLDRPRVLA